MKRKTVMSFILFSALLPVATSQQSEKDALAKGKNLIDTQIYTLDDDARILELFKELRVADVSDAGARDTDEVGLEG